MTDREKTLIQQQIVEKKNRIARLKAALDDIPPGVTSFSVDGTSFSYDRQAILKEIRQEEFAIKALLRSIDSRLIRVDIGEMW